MIITVTLNPSIDRTMHLQNIYLGEINRARYTTLDPGGKGVNVSRALRSYGAKTYAVLVCGQLGQHWFSETLTLADIPHKIVNAQGITRTNITLVESDGRVTKINESGFTLTQVDLDNVRNAIASQELSNSWVVLAGRLNPGLDSHTYCDLAKFAKEKGAKVAVDASGAELKATISAGVVDLIKPNQHELSELVNRPLHTTQDVIIAAREIISVGVPTVLCSLGADGALLITADDVVHCEPREQVTGTPVGAGDILLGIFLGAGADVEALEKGVAWSAASVPLEGTSIPSPAQAALIKINTKLHFDDNRDLVEVE